MLPWKQISANLNKWTAIEKLGPTGSLDHREDIRHELSNGQGYYCQLLIFHKNILTNKIYTWIQNTFDTDNKKQEYTKKETDGIT